MGKSRSAAVCIAYLLHQTSGHTPQSALALVQRGRPLCEPNDGFMEQLNLYHEMGCPEDITSHPLYQRWLYRRDVEESVACGRAPEIESVRFEDEQPLRPQGNHNQTVEIKCRKCRYVSLLPKYWISIHEQMLITYSRTVASTPDIIPHEQDKKIHGRTRPNTECSYVFLHPLKWMKPSLFPTSTGKEYGGDAPLSGRLICPNPTCGGNIGKFAWQGMPCSCNNWMVPALGLAKARVDIATRMNMAQRSPAALGIRLPPGMRPVEPNDPGRGNL